MAASGKGNPFFSGFLAGLFTGLALAVAVALLVTRNNPFVEPASDTGGKATTAAGAPIEAPKYEFGPPPTAIAEPAPAEAPQATVATPPAAPASPSYFLQAGAYGQAAEADQLKASLAMQGFETSIVSAAEGDKTLHKVRIGPFKSLDELNRARARLTQSGIETILVKNP